MRKATDEKCSIKHVTCSAVEGGRGEGGGIKNSKLGPDCESMELITVEGLQILTGKNKHLTRVYLYVHALYLVHTFFFFSPSPIFRRARAIKHLEPTRKHLKKKRKTKKTLQNLALLGAHLNTSWLCAPSASCARAARGSALPSLYPRAPEDAF